MPRPPVPQPTTSRTRRAGRTAAGLAALLALAAACRPASGDGAAAATQATQVAPPPAPAPVLPAPSPSAAAASNGGVVVLKTGARISAAKPPVVALGRLLYETPDGAQHALALDLVDLEATRMSSPAATLAQRPASNPAAASRSGIPPASARPAAPEFEAVGMDGKPVKLSDLKGKVVLVDFWATWCGPCVQEMPNVKRTYEGLEKKGFKILGVSLDHDRARLDAYIKANQLSWPQQFDGQGWGNEVAQKYRVQSIPHTVLVDRSGRIARIGIRGPMLSAAVEELLAEKS